MTHPANVAWENKLLAIGFIKDVPVSYYTWADRLSKPARTFVMTISGKR